MSKSVYNLAHILPWPGVGGTENATLRLAEAVAPRGFRSVAFCMPTAASVVELFEGAGFEVATWSARDPRWDGWRAFLRDTLRLAWEFRRRGIDLVECADVHAATWQVVAAARLARLPVLCHVRNRNADPVFGRQRSLRGVDRFIFMSNDTWRTFAYPVPRERGLVIYDGVPVPEEDPDREERSRIREEVRREFGMPEGAKVVGMVARVEPQKDFATLSRAVARVVAAEPNTRFLVVGGTDRTEEQRRHYPEVKRLVEGSGVAPYITFAGFRTDVPRLLRAMDVSVLSTNWEGLPLVIWEAMAEGLPVVATAVDGIPEIVRHGETGLLVPHEDDEQLAAHLFCLLSDEEQARRLGAAGRDFVRTNFSVESFAGSMVDVYEEALGLRNGSGA